MRSHLSSLTLFIVGIVAIMIACDALMNLYEVLYGRFGRKKSRLYLISKRLLRECGCNVYIVGLRPGVERTENVLQQEFRKAGLVDAEQDVIYTMKYNGDVPDDPVSSKVESGSFVTIDGPHAIYHHDTRRFDPDECFVCMDARCALSHALGSAEKISVTEAA
ncbi:MAG TPA: hypothetical protein VIR98_03115 [Candidatus Paceibacterota bacterium]|jgi:hypothetical protein